MSKIKNTVKVLPKSQVTSSCLADIIERFNSEKFINNVCLSYRHDFGITTEYDRQRIKFECKEWMRAIKNNWEYFDKNDL